MNDKNCATCVCAKECDGLVCVNSKSEYCGQLVFLYDSCEFWEGIEEVSELKPCPFCGGKSEIRNIGKGDYGEWAVVCMDDKCGILGRIEETEKRAAKAWNRRAEQTDCKNPQPLTLEQLRQMDGNPVWVEQINGVIEQGLLLG